MDPARNEGYFPRKRSKVYAIRTFPEGCGVPHASKMNSKESNEVTNTRKRPKVYAIRTFPDGCSKESSHPPMANNKVPLQANDFSRDKVKYALHCFKEMLSKLLEENGSRCRADTMAAKLLKKKLKWINTVQRIGAIPGVQVGDVFEWIAELNVIGLHHQSLNGIDFTKTTNGTTLATSVIASGRYANLFESSDVLIYSGHGGNPSLKGGGHPQDQRLIRGNLALKNSMEVRTPVRVIRGFKFSKSRKFTRTSFKKNTVYVYDGLYYVEKYWQERGRFGKLVFMFSLKRILGQPRLPLSRSEFR